MMAEETERLRLSACPSMGIFVLCVLFLSQRGERPSCSVPIIIADGLMKSIS